MAKYPYTILPGDKRSVYKSLIPVTLNYKKTHKITLPVTALIDSGADVCFCSKNIGVWLGIQFAKKKRTKFTAANRSTFWASREDVTFYAGGKHYNCPFFFTDVLPKETPIILGQFGFFDHFKITFDVRNKLIEIT